MFMVCYSILEKYEAKIAQEFQRLRLELLRAQPTNKATPLGSQATGTGNHDPRKTLSVRESYMKFLRSLYQYKSAKDLNKRGQSQKLAKVTPVGTA